MLNVSYFLQIFSTTHLKRWEFASQNCKKVFLKLKWSKYCFNLSKKRWILLSSLSSWRSKMNEIRKFSDFWQMPFFRTAASSTLFIPTQMSPDSSTIGTFSKFLGLDQVFIFAIIMGLISNQPYLTWFNLTSLIDLRA